jgi:glycosyltransferase 2 family protein
MFLVSIRNANYSYLPIIFLWGSLTSWVRAMRWRVLLSADADIPARNVFWANMAGYLGNNILPSRAGELIRAVYVGKENNISTSFSLATGFVERFIDLVSLVLLGSSSLAYSGIISGDIQSALQVMSVVATVGVLLIVTVPFFGSHLLRIISSFPIFKTSAGEKVLLFFQQFLHGIEALHHMKRATLLLLYTCIVWLMDGLGVVLVARSMQLDILLSHAFVLLAALGLSSAIPSTPGYVGVYQFVAVLVLEPFGISKSNALAFIIFLQVINFLVVAFWGGIAVTRASSLARPQAYP